MVRIRTLTARKATKSLLEIYGGRFTDDFAANKAVVSQLIYTPSPRLKNFIDGYTTKLVKKGKSGSKQKVPPVDEDFSLQQF